MQRIVDEMRLTRDDIAEITGLIEGAEDHDKVGPVAEHTILRLREGGGGSGRDLLLYESDDALAGYAYLDTAPSIPVAEFVVRPGRRRRGHGRALVSALREAADGPFRVWAHGELPAARALAAATGFTRVRALWQLRRSLAEPVPEPEFPADVRLRTYDPARDAADWVELNHRAFADHPEQGAWTVDDLRRREDEPWFDPAGFFLAERADRLVGFHWTKVHAVYRPPEVPGPIGEVYVVGIDPAARGTGLGRALTLAGLRHLRDIGLPDVMLYVDESNTAAVRLYASLGFTRWNTDAMYEWRPAGD
jgi:mycothiol synthase